MTARIELIVDNDALDDVSARLAELGVLAGAPSQDRDDDLGLTLLSDFGDLTNYEATTRHRYLNEIAALEHRTAREFTDLDVLLYDLRTYFSSTRGFVPVLGKNRDTFVGYPQHKGYGDPEPLDQPYSLPSKTGDGVKVGVVDTPLCPNDLFAGYSVEADAEVPEPVRGPYTMWSGHGTFVVGKILEQAPDAHVILKAGLDDKTGKSSIWETAKKIAAFRHSGIQVLNLSFGTTTGDGQPPLALLRSIVRLREHNPELLVVAAAGNKGYLARPPEEIWPAAMTDVEAVGADDALFSMKRSWVDVTAAGLGVLGPYVHGDVELSGSTEKFAGCARWSGTSFAAATVTGALAKFLQGKASPKDALKDLVSGSNAVARPFVPA